MPKSPFIGISINNWSAISSGSGDSREGREYSRRMGMAAGTPPTRGTWFPRGPRAEVPGSRNRTERRE